MNVFQRVTFKTLLKNKTRTIVTIIGIALSAAMLCAVTSSITSLMDFGQQNMAYTCGDWFGCAIGVTEQDVSTIKQETASGVVAQQIGYSVLDGCTNEEKPYLFVLGAGEGFTETMPVHLISGRLPENSGEIILPDHLSSNGGITHSLGDKLTLTLGNRMQGDTVLGQRCNLLDDENEGGTETFVPRDTREYVVTGFYERADFETYGAPGYTAITVMDESFADEYLFDVYYKTAKASDVYAYASCHDYFSDTNSNLLMFMGISGHEAFGTVLYGLAAIIIILIMFGAISLIYNAFSISVSERTKQFGLLSSVGATSKQIRSCVTFEALSLSVIGIPLGILAGLFGMWVTFSLLGEKFMSLGQDFNVPMRLKTSPLGIVITIIIAVLTVLISARIPSRRAMKVTAIEAIRQSRDISATAKHIKTPKIAYKLFGLPGMLANKYFKRSRKKYRATILSLFMSVVLFVAASSLTGYMTESVSGTFNVDKYDVSLYLSNENNQGVDGTELLNKMKTEANVTSASMSSYFVEKAYFTPENSSFEEHSFLMCFVDDESYAEYAESLNLSNSQQDVESPKAIAVEGYADFDMESGRMETEKILSGDKCELSIFVPKDIEGYSFLSSRFVSEDSSDKIYVYASDTNPNETIELSESKALIEKTLTTCRLVTEAPKFLVRAASLTLIYPKSAMDEVCGKNYDEYSSAIHYWTMVSDNHEETYTNVSQMLGTMKIGTASLSDNAKESEQNRNIVTIINVFSYGFIVLISLVAVANVFNTVSTNIGLRRRDFAMLKSVGITKRGLNAMMNYECLLYGTRALALGLIVSFALTVAIYEVIQQGFQSAFRVPWVAMIIASISVFLVVFVTMMYSMRKIKKDNPIDALKNENL